jgi:hypothetical protein
MKSLLVINPDMSMYVPFYAKGVTHKTKEIREKDGLVFSTKAVSCRMLGYADADPIHKMHNTYLVLIEGRVFARHDCYFEHYTEHPSLLNEDINKRVSYPDEQSEIDDYDHVFGKQEIVLPQFIPIEDNDNHNLRSKNKFDYKNSNKKGFRDHIYTITGWIDQVNLAKTPIKSRFVFRLKPMLDNTFKYKARLVVCGYSQKYGRDYDRTFAPTAKLKSMCILLHIAALFDWDRKFQCRKCLYRSVYRS